MSFFLFSLLVITLLVIIGFWFFFWLANQRTALPQEDCHVWPEIRVIISYKNAEKHLRKTIDAILGQDYAHFEVIAIDDFSTDLSTTTLSDIKDPKLKMISAMANVPGKKAALTQAIAEAKYEVFLFTDADCMPVSNQWIKTMVRSLLSQSNHEIVLGFGPMTKEKSLINAFARHETILTAMQYISYAVFKMPYMGVGRNLLYKRSVFDRVDGFQHHSQIASGDDDLLINIGANNVNTVVNLDSLGFVYSHSKDTLSAFLQQKSRHISTSFYYSFIHKVLLALFSFCQILFYAVLCIGSILGIWSLTFAFVTILIKWTLQMSLQWDFVRKLDGKDILWQFPLLDMLMPLYYVTLTVYAIFRKKGQW